MRPGTKLAALRRPQGATSLQLILTTGWQPHTARGAISGMLRKKFGLNVVLASGYIAWYDHHRKGVNSTHALVGRGSKSWTPSVADFVRLGCKPANPVRTQVRTFPILLHPTQARAVAAFDPSGHAVGCEPQTLQTLFSWQSVAQCCAVAPRIGFSAGRTRFACGGRLGRKS